MYFTSKPSHVNNSLFYPFIFSLKYVIHVSPAKSALFKDFSPHTLLSNTYDHNNDIKNHTCGSPRSLHRQRRRH
ncbi:hypothetical protein BDV95DRAFT_560334 [Massariosphaeria phaeospora]|uniref:Uncharacterized protein n=1 Tax=Massariosphaeria phaeospora TaxID=100035 RepID=A0A7C8MIG3_9PLEO|nr:hypothetical protein BDV95DRAFT_560334 [Massariosphaeria phaeospora]